MFRKLNTTGKIRYFHRNLVLENSDEKQKRVSRGGTTKSRRDSDIEHGIRISRWEIIRNNLVNTKSALGALLNMADNTAGGTR